MGRQLKGEDGPLPGMKVTWLQTFTGRYFYPTAPCPDDVDIRDIAHALSQICRYAGHTSEFYSVAEHSWLVSTMVPEEYALHALLHDAAEAYCQDLPSSVKQALPAYKEMEDQIQRAIWYKFNLYPEEPRIVKQADLDILYTEKDRVLGNTPPWTQIPGTKRAGLRLECWQPKAAEYAFLTRFERLTHERGGSNDPLAAS
jgi:hypothetical protein